MQPSLAWASKGSSHGRLKAGMTVQGGDDLEGFFAFNAQRTLEAPSGKLSILVDETSMLDMSLASSLLDALPTDIPVQLVLVGEDASQALELHIILCSCKSRSVLTIGWQPCLSLVQHDLRWAAAMRCCCLVH